MGIVMLLTQPIPRSLPDGFRRRNPLPVAIVGVCDLSLGSTLREYSGSTTGVAVTVLLASVSPLLTQVFSKLLGKEAPSNQEVLGGLVITCTVVIAVAVM